MIDPEEIKFNEETERKIRTAFQFQDPDPLFIDRLQKQLRDRFIDLERSAERKNIFAGLAQWLGKSRLLVSPLGWGAIALIIILFLTWGIRTLIPRVEPSVSGRSTPSPSIAPTTTATQAEGAKGVIRLPSLAGMPVPWPEEAITSKNAGRVTELARWRMGMIYGMAWSPDGKAFAIASATGIHLYDVATFKETKTIANDSSVGAPAFSPDGTKLAAGINKSSVEIWDIASGRRLQTLAGYKNSITKVAYLPSGDSLVTKAYEEPIKLWAVNSGQELRSIGGSDVADFALSPDGTLIATISVSKTIQLWDMASGHVLRILSGHTDSVSSVAFSLDGNKLASASVDKTIKVWDVAKGIELTSMAVSTGPVSTVYYSPDGFTLASIDFHGRFQLWNIASGLEVPTHFGALQVGYIAFSPDGKTILASMITDNTIKLWEVASGQELLSLDLPFDWQSSAIESVAVSPVGELIASGSYNGLITLWDSANGQVIRTLTGNTGEVMHLAFSPDGSLLASGSGNEIQLWEVTSGKEILTLAGPPFESYFTGDPCVAFSPDGKILAYGAEAGQVKLWDINNQQMLLALGGNPGGGNPDFITGISYSPDGKMLASIYGAGSITLWDTATGAELKTLVGRSASVVLGGYDLTFSPNGEYLAAWSSTMSVKVWQATNGNLVRTLGGHEDSAMVGLTFSLDGQVLALGSDLGSIILWDIASGQKLNTLAGPAASLALSPDGHVLVSVSWDGMIRLWGVPDY